jgi:hypothetical protein
MISPTHYPLLGNILDDVRQQSGLDDFGDDSFREGLGRLLHSLAHEAQLDGAAARKVIEQIKRRLTNRLEVEEWYRVHPETNQVVIGRPTSITGLPRTGTTALTNILSLDEQFRPLRSWEQNKPCPPPVLGEEHSDPRRLAAEAEVARIASEMPEFAAMHLSDPNATEEDVELLGMAFGAQQLALPIYGYHAWWRETDLRAAFRYHRRVIALLQSRRPPDTWLFKAPAHNFHLEAVFTAYPDMRMIITHRDPAKAIPSAISLLIALQPTGQKLAPEAFGRLHAEHLRVGTERAMAARSRIGEDRFLDVHHKEFVADPFGTIDRIYHFLGKELRPEVLARMKEWHISNRSGAHGSHRYTAEQFGLSASQIRSDFAPYIERYDIAPES